MTTRIAVLALIVAVAASAAVYAASVSALGTESQSSGASSFCGSVVSARHAVELRGEPVFLTLGHADGDQDLTVVMLAENRARFGSPEALIGRRICVSGRVQSFFGKPRMLPDTLTE
jgi:hypothetical protein